MLYTPGHTDDSYSFLMNDRVFTGDTLLIRGTGRTDFQNGDARAQYDSIFNKLLRLPDDTLVYPAHDYKGETVSTIGEEKAFNPRLQVKSIDQYVELMNKLNLPNPKMMDVAVPANMRVGFAQEAIAQRGWAVSAAAAIGARRPARRGAGRPAREEPSARSTASSRARCTRPIPTCRTNVRPAACCTSLRAATGKRMLFYCAFGERSAMAVQAAQDAGIASACHIHGGIDAWKKAQRRRWRANDC